MNELLPIWLNLFFVFTTFLCLYFGFKVLKSSTATSQYALRICGFMLIWLFVQAILTVKGVYRNDPNTLPPKIILMGIMPMAICIISIFVFRRSRNIIETFSLTSLAYLSMVRIPVELALFFLYGEKLIPKIMTFEGQNWDIVSGLTAPLIVYVFNSYKNKSILLVWHFICLGLLINIVYLAIFSAPLPFQKFGFEQPNLAIVEFPFSWLPTFIVPWVLFTHLVSIKILLARKLFSLKS